jgi:hypothetical protein
MPKYAKPDAHGIYTSTVSTIRRHQPKGSVEYNGVPLPAKLVEGTLVSLTDAEIQQWQADKESARLAPLMPTITKILGTVQDLAVAGIVFDPLPANVLDAIDQLGDVSQLTTEQANLVNTITALWQYLKDIDGEWSDVIQVAEAL